MSQLLSAAGSPTSEPALELITLGRFQIRRRGLPLPDDAWPTQKSKQLVKLLLTRRGELTPADQIMEWLWPGLSPDRARNNLWVAVSQARRVLEPELPPRAPSAYIASEGDGYRFLADSDHRWDVADFRRAAAAARAQTNPAARTEALEAACALYTGDYLAEDPYEEWAMALRGALRTEYIDLLLALGESYAQAGRYAQAVAQAQAVLALEPASEPAYQALMRYHYFAGDQRAARLAYDDCVRVLREELDAPPMPATVELYRQIQRHTLPLPTGAAPVAVPEETAYSLTRTPFVGRTREYNTLVRAIQAAADGQGRIVLIEGEPGIGKSRLVQEAIAYARGQGMTTLLAHCYQVEQAIPYQPIVDMLDQALAETPARLFLDLPPVYLAELATLAPELETLLDEAPVPPEEGGVRQLRRFRALQQCLELLAGEQGLILAMDDIHWADHPTRQFLHHLATHIARLPILLICTYRSEEAAADPELATFIDSVSRTPQATRLALSRLSPGDTGALLDLLTGSSEIAGHLSEWLHAETDGNPFFVISILQSLVEQELLYETRPAWQMDAQRIDTCDASLALPDALRESVRVRLRRLPTPMRRVLEVAAVLGRRFDFATLAAASGEREDTLLEIVEGLLQRQLLRETGPAEAGPYGLGHDFDFSHDKIREVVYHDISSARRVLLHRNVAQALELLGDVAAHERAANLAHHFEHGQVWDKAIHYLVQAAERSRELFAVRETASFYDRALALADARPGLMDQSLRLMLLQRRGEARTLMGLTQEAAADLHLVLDAAKAAGDPAQQCEVLIALGQVYRMGDELDRAMEYLTAALHLCRESGDRRSLANVLHHLGTVAWSAGNNLQASIYHQEAADLSRGLEEQDLIAVQALHGRGEAFVAAARPHYAIQLFEESLEIARRIGDKRYEGENLQMIGWCHMGLTGTGDYAQAQEMLAQSLAISEEAHVEWSIAITRSFLGWVYACLGDYRRGLALVQSALEELHALHLARFLSISYDILGYIYQDLNLHQEALDAHAKGLQIGIEANVGFWLPRLCADVAIDRLRLGEWSAGHDLEVALSLTIEDYQRFHAVRCLEGLMEEGVLSGRLDRTLHYAAVLESISQAGGLREQQAHVHRWRGVAYRLLGDQARAEQELAQALALAEEIGRVRLRWDVHAELAALYRAQGDLARATEHEEVVAALVQQIADNLQDPALCRALPPALVVS